jgi:hypothetical protein
VWLSDFSGEDDAGQDEQVLDPLARPHLDEQAAQDAGDGDRGFRDDEARL